MKNPLHPSLELSAMRGLMFLVYGLYQDNCPPCWLEDFVWQAKVQAEAIEIVRKFRSSEALARLDDLALRIWEADPELLLLFCGLNEESFPGGEEFGEDPEIDAQMTKLRGMMTDEEVELLNSCTEELFYSESGSIWLNEAGEPS